MPCFHAVVFFQAAGLGAFGCVLAAGRGLAAPVGQKPNFVFLLVDDLGWRDLGCYGSPFYETPHIDALAATGVRFTQAYAACPVCSPTRASIMSGKHPARMDTTDWFGTPQPDNVKRRYMRDKPLLPAPYKEHLPLEEVTMAEAFESAGYATFFAGKWHLGGAGHSPEDQGFAVNKGGHHRGSPPGGYFSPYENPKLKDGPEGEHLPARLADETVDFIAAHRDKPFLAYLSFYSVHTPLQAANEFKTKYKEKAEAVKEEPVWGEEGERKVRRVQKHPVYAGMVEAMDAAVGTVLDALKEQGLADNTVVILMSDNGGLSTSEGHPTSNLPLRAGKGWLYEGGIREPMIIRWPGVTEAGRVCETPVTSTDFYPTMLAMAGLPPRPKQHVDGVSLTPLLRGEKTSGRDTLYWHYPHYGNQGGSPGAAIREGDLKLVHLFGDGHVELYNLAQDLGEEHNLAAAQPDRAQAMLEKLKAWQKSVDAKFPSPNPKGRQTTK